MRTRHFAAVAALLLAGSLVACGGGSTAAPAGVAPAPAGNLQVVNNSSQDMDVFLVLHNGQRTRLGLAPGAKTTGFALTPAQVAGVGPVTFEAVPILRGGRSVTSDQVNVTPRETITLEIPAQ